MTTVRVEGLLRSLGCPVEFAELDEGAIREIIALRRPGVVVLDLAVAGALRSAVYSAAQQAEVPIVAFGAHVDSGALAEAKRDGAADVLTRGALAHGLGPLVGKHLARADGMAGSGPT